MVELNFKILKILDTVEGDFQIVIYRDESGLISFAKRWWSEAQGSYGKLGPACGFYDSVETAEREAIFRNFGISPQQKSKN